MNEKNLEDRIIVEQIADEIAPKSEYTPGDILEKFEAEFFKNSVPYLINRASVYFKLHATQVFSALNKELTLEQFVTLCTVANNSDICQRDLCKLILKDRSNVGRILNILDDKGYIRREIEIKNNRLVKKIYINPEGQKVVDECLPPFKQTLIHTIEKFDKVDLDVLRGILTHVTEVLSKETNIQI